MRFLEILFDSQIHIGILWDILRFFLILRYILGFFGILGDSQVYIGVLSVSLRFVEILFDSQVHIGILWEYLRFSWDS